MEATSIMLVAIAVKKGQIELRGDDSRASGSRIANGRDDDLATVEPQAGGDRQRIRLVP